MISMLTAVSFSTLNSYKFVFPTQFFSFKDPPWISTQSSSSQQVVKNSTAMFTCDFSAYPRPNVTWSRHPASLRKQGKCACEFPGKIKHS